MVDWNIFSAISTGLGAFATFIACAISLYQTRIANKKRLKIVIQWNMVIVPSTEPDKSYVDITLINIGNKPIIINAVGYQRVGQKGFVLVNPHQTHDGKILPGTEHIIEPEHSAYFMFERTNFIGYLEGELQKGYRLRIFCRDSTGQVYCKRIKKKDWMEKKEKE